MPAARIRPGFFMPFLRGGGLGGEPDQGHYGGDWRRYYQVNYLIEHGDGDLLRWYPNL